MQPVNWRLAPAEDWDAHRVNTYLEEYNNHMLDILTIHEGYPGHSVQLEYNEPESFPGSKVCSQGCTSKAGRSIPSR